MNRAIKTILFDLDNTLYPKENGLLDHISHRIASFSEVYFNLDKSEAEKLRVHYRDLYGASISGYIKHNGVDPEVYNDYVYDIDYAKFITIDKPLQTMLHSIKQRKIIYTNGAKVHVDRFIRHSGLEGCFDAAICIEDTLFHPKPLPQSFREMIRCTDLDCSATLFVDDQPRNLAEAERFGIKTVMIGSNIQQFQCINNILEIKNILC